MEEIQKKRNCEASLKDLFTIFDNLGLQMTQKDMKFIVVLMNLIKYNGGKMSEDQKKDFQDWIRPAMDQEMFIFLVKMWNNIAEFKGQQEMKLSIQKKYKGNFINEHSYLGN